MDRPIVTTEDVKRAKQASTSLGIPLHVIVTNSNQIVTYVNPSFENFTGFRKEEVIGRKCNFLQGEGTDPRDLMDMKVAVRSLRETNVVVLNYTKSHHAFWNTLRIRPILQNGNQVLGFIGEIFSLPVSDELQRSRPRLCLDDALALMRVTSSVPRFVPASVESILMDHLEEEDDNENILEVAEMDNNDKKEGEEKVEKAVMEQQTVLIVPQPTPSLSLQRHVNYSQRFSTGSPSPTSSPSPPSTPTKKDDKQQDTLPNFDFVAETLLPTIHGRYRVRAYRNVVSGAEPLAMIVGEVENCSKVLIRVHDQCQTSEVFGSLRCDCKEQLDAALARIQKENGIVLYLPQEGRGIGIANKVAAYAAQELGLDTVDANRHLGLPDDAREYTAVRDILKDLGISSVRLMTNNPRKINELTALGINVVERVPIITPPNSQYSLAYVKAKQERMFHMFEEV